MFQFIFIWDTRSNGGSSSSRDSQQIYERRNEMIFVFYGHSKPFYWRLTLENSHWLTSVFIYLYTSSAASMSLTAEKLCVSHFSFVLNHSVAAVVVVSFLRRFSQIMNIYRLIHIRATIKLNPLFEVGLHARVYLSENKIMYRSICVDTHAHMAEMYVWPKINWW